jgi:hypothetical protein
VVGNDNGSTCGCSSARVVTGRGICDAVGASGYLSISTWAAGS